MQEARRQQLLRELGVDQYQLRSAAQAVSQASESEAFREYPVAEPASFQVAEPTVKEVEKTVPKAESAKPPKAAKAAKPEGAVPLTLLWWQFEDLLLIEAAAPGSSSSDPALLRLAQNIAVALGRTQGLNGELHWPPGGDFSVISLADCLRHFVQGRAEVAKTELQVLLASDALHTEAAGLGNVHVIASLSAMLTDPSLKSATWQTLKALRRA